MNKKTDKIDIKKYQFYKDLTYLTFVQEIWLFGSRVHGDHQMRADIDLAIYCPQANSKDWLTILAQMVGTCDSGNVVLYPLYFLESRAVDKKVFLLYILTQSLSSHRLQRFLFILNSIPQ